MALDSDQLTVLAADIAADGVLSAIPNTQDGAFAIAQAYNLTASPDFYVWKTDYSTKDIRENMVWDEYLTTDASDKSTFELMISNGIVNMANVNVRAGINEIFKKAGQSNALSALIAGGNRLALRGEKLFASGVGSQADPATMAVEGNIAYQDVFAARNL